MKTQKDAREKRLTLSFVRLSDNSYYTLFAPLLSTIIVLFRCPILYAVLRLLPRLFLRKPRLQILLCVSLIIPAVFARLYKLVCHTVVIPVAIILRHSVFIPFKRCLSSAFYFSVLPCLAYCLCHYSLPLQYPCNIPLLPSCFLIVRQARLLLRLLLLPPSLLFLSVNPMLYKQ